MKIIVIAGSYSKIGKSTLAANIHARLDCFKLQTIKIGHNKPQAHKTVTMFQSIDAAIEYINNLQAINSLDYLIIESNTILRFIEADLVVFLKNHDKPEKQSSELAKSKADIIIDRHFDYNNASEKVIEKLGHNTIADALLEQYIYMYNS